MEIDGPGDTAPEARPDLFEEAMIWECVSNHVYVLNGKSRVSSGGSTYWPGRGGGATHSRQEPPGAALAAA